MQNTWLSEYTENMRFVNGFCSVETMHVLDYVSQNVEIKNSLEIGIHHGQMFIGINQCTSNTSYAVDVFDEQNLNVDKSGLGNKELFEHNLKNYDSRHGGKNVVIIQGDSLDDNTFRDILECDFISIDGGHTVEHVVNDLSICSKLITSHGVIVVDDYLNHWWPSVTEGIFKYFSFATPKIIPFCSSKNKLWLCKISHHEKYFNMIRHIEHFGKTETKLFGHFLVDLW